MPERTGLPEGGAGREGGGEDDAGATTPDAGAADASAEAEAGGPPRVFATSALVSGNLMGQTAGDALCADLASKAKLGGAWVAWLSKEGGPDAVDRLTSAGPFYLVTGELVAKDKAELTGTLRHAIDRTETGALITANVRVWTGTGPNGRYRTNDCDGWTTGNQGRTGSTAERDNDWTSDDVRSCSEKHRLYCFEL